jgi:hypothetical protein
MLVAQRAKALEESNRAAIARVNRRNRTRRATLVLELDESLNRKYKIFEAAPQEARGVPLKNPSPDYFL